MNINDTVTVKLTNFGKHILDEYRIKIERDMDDGYKFKTLMYDEEGFYTSELWRIMAIFGNYVSNSTKYQVFVNNQIVTPGGYIKRNVHNVEECPYTCADENNIIKVLQCEVENCICNYKSACKYR